MTRRPEYSPISKPSYYTLEEAIYRWPELEMAAQALVRVIDYKTGVFGSGVVTSNHVLTAKHMLNDTSGDISIDGMIRIHLPDYTPQPEPIPVLDGIGVMFGNSPDCIAIPTPQALSQHPKIDISFDKVNEGDEVFNIGYIPHRRLIFYDKAIPIVLQARVLYTFGNIIAVSYLMDLDIHGMSGGPLVKNGQLVGTSMGTHNANSIYNVSLARMKELGLLG